MIVIARRPRVVYANEEERKAAQRDYLSHYRKVNKEKIAATQRKWKEANKEHCKKYEANRKRNDTSVKLCTSLRSRIRAAVQVKCKSGSAVRDLGCTGQEACDYIESLFDEHMTWDNWGTYWHLDHIYPLAAADLEDKVQLLAVCNYRNLQPLEKGANQIKGDTVTPEAQALFDELCRTLDK